MLVECGVFCRPVNFTCNNMNGGDVSSLKEAISQTFPNLRKEHIALLQIKSEEYQGHFVDILDPTVVIGHNSLIKVILYNEVSSI